MSITGQIVNNRYNAVQGPIAGAKVRLGSQEVETDASGNFAFTSVPLGSDRLVVSAPGYLGPREKSIALEQNRQGITLDLIALRPPFIEDFWNQFNRSSFDSGGVLLPLKVRTAPIEGVYIKTTVEDGRPVDPGFLQDVIHVLRNSARELLDQELSPGMFQMGPDARPLQNNWSHIIFETSIEGAPGAGGVATLGTNQGTMRVRYDPDEPVSSTPLCKNTTLVTVHHEANHLWAGAGHTTFSGVYTAEDFTCTGAGRSAATIYHSRLAYETRTFDNDAPDRDPAGSLLAGTGGTDVVVCYF